MSFVNLERFSNAAINGFGIRKRRVSIIPSKDIKKEGEEESIPTEHITQNPRLAPSSVQSTMPGTTGTNTLETALNQRQLAQALGLEQNYVARIETGQRRLDVIEWIQVLRALGVDPD